MKRRRCVVAPFAAGLAMGFERAGAQKAERMSRIGVLFLNRRFEDSELWSEFVQELARLGHVEGRNLVFEKRYGKNPVDQDALAVELAQRAPDLIFTVGGVDSTLAAKRATAKIPIVFYASADPVGFGLVSSLARPGGNVTGTAMLSFEIAPKAMDLLAQATGRYRRIAYLHPASTRSLGWYPRMEAAITSAAKVLGATAVFIDVEDGEAWESVLKRLAQQAVDAAIIATAMPADAQAVRQIATLFIERKLRTIGNPDDGFLLGYSSSWHERARLAASLVDRILKGAKPAELPVQQPTRYELVVNLRTAKALGLTISKSILLRADRLIE